MAAVGAMHSFSTSIAFKLTSTEKNSDSAHLPWLIALYDALNDDDDEVRAAAAAVATPLLSNQRLISVEAGRRLLHWLLARYGDNDEFRAHVACRMAGNLPSSPSSSYVAPEQGPTSTNPSTAKQLLEGWIPAEAQLTEAMRFDDSLFVIEEQNLYVDEVREAHRWSNIFSSLPQPSSSSATAALSQWCLSGLETLSRIAAAEGTDGPLGWTSKPEVFAICARILVSGTALAAAGDEQIRGAVRRFRDKGRRTEVSGLLLGMCAGLYE